MGNQVKYIPQLATVFILLFILFGFDPLVRLFTLLGLSAAAAMGLVLLMAGLPLIVLVGLGSNKKRFIISLLVLVLGIILLVLFL